MLQFKRPIENSGSGNFHRNSKSQRPQTKEQSTGQPGPQTTAAEVNLRGKGTKNFALRPKKDLAPSQQGQPTFFGDLARSHSSFKGFKHDIKKVLDYIGRKTKNCGAQQKGKSKFKESPFEGSFPRLDSSCKTQRLMFPAKQGIALDKTKPLPPAYWPDDTVKILAPEGPPLRPTKVCELWMR